MSNKNPIGAESSSSNEEALAEAVRILRAQGLVAFPTETVYGLGADATSDQAVARIFEAKGRPQFNPLIVHVASADQARGLGKFNETADRLAAELWPGPLSLVVPRTPDCPVSMLASAGLETIALRVPSHPLAQALLNAAQLPLAAPSANRSGSISPTTAAHVHDSLGHAVDLVLDGGACPVGVESTIVDCCLDEPVVLRFGGVTRDSIEQVIGRPIGFREAGETPTAPGQLVSHYAPRAALRLNVQDTGNGEALLGFGTPVPDHKGAFLNLSEKGDLLEAAANLFAHLHTLDASGADTIAVMPVPGTGLGEAINDRLERAAAPRSA